jgi:hypothetical protein
VSAERKLFFEAVKNYFIWILFALMSVAFTWHVVSWSEQHGKLAMPPDYDDSHSLVEGAVRFLNFQNSGLGAAWDEYRLRNPHSFLHYYWRHCFLWAVLARWSGHGEGRIPRRGFSRQRCVLP